MTGTKRFSNPTYDSTCVQAESRKKRPRREELSSDQEGSDSEQEISELSRISMKTKAVEAANDSSPAITSIPSSFLSMGISSPLRAALSNMAIHVPTEIQAVCIPPILAGKSDQRHLLRIDTDFLPKVEIVLAMPKLGLARPLRLRCLFCRCCPPTHTESMHLF
jgi:hypothetical protein